MRTHFANENAEDQIMTDFMEKGVEKIDSSINIDSEIMP